ncbi:UvrD-helicase domain-containing protein [Merismopedia glauca]|uniref:UvrD-like helicase ATP-binding domain-containing protein n=1 Tax=Merismopedia glauca CCAP 1448/3 TaxID=1296344 RepID=A0A2T1C3H1_9CYAN|nr:UvrD-helicase domain-containing protein [Merismopedia glauca]PSB02820.1 hypothetical protein C7B64_11375 [Merismopedia glauca CCAP 1448/3]
MYVYISSEVKNNHPQQLKAIEDMQKRIEGGDPLLFGLLFSPRFPLWIKKIWGGWRLIATLISVEDEQILCCTHLLTRGGHDYRNFLDNHEIWGHNNITLNQEQLRQWLQERQQVKPREKLVLPNKAWEWLRKPELLQPENRTIFESKEWVEQWSDRQSGINDNWSTFHRIVVHLLENDRKDYKIEDYKIEKTIQAQVKVCIEPQTNCAIVYSKVNPSDAPEREIWFLLKAFTKRPTQTEIAQLGHRLGLFGAAVNRDLFAQPVTADNLARFARRSYPDYLVYDPEIWHSLEEETEANLALSGEEEELLHNMQFPAFINGRAGSGKSTMLHYAFAYYADLYLKQVHESGNESLRPLFLTYSDRLTNRARDVVKQILISHVQYIANIRTYLQPDSLNLLDGCFESFQSFLLQQLPPEDVDLFKKENYVSFHRFKQLYQHSFPNPRHNAEICWHAIRTYIKGFDFTERGGELIDIEEYRNELCQADKSIADDVFADIYRTVWDWYQKLQREQHYWDDQDLVRKVLQNMVEGDGLQHGYAAIFCDEAQDFTRLELQLIFRLSMWSQYRLLPPIQSLPFAFAGDPMQTLNPTGFDWNQIRAAFYERILIPIDPENQIGLRDRTMLRDLQQNYRSTRGIVRFSNVVHLWRRILFNLNNLNPQTPWWKSEGVCPPLKGIIDGNIGNITVTELHSIANGDAIFILPCNDGGELAFLRDLPKMKQIFPEIEKNEIPLRVYSSVAVKGMEFSPVVVCGFGEYFAREFEDSCLENLQVDSKNLKLQYFLNKLYVALSRSTRILGIIQYGSVKEKVVSLANERCGIQPIIQRQ